VPDISILHADELGLQIAGVFVDGEDVNIPGKLTVGGLIDPTGLILTEQSSDPMSTTDVGLYAGDTANLEEAWWRRSDGSLVDLSASGSQGSVNGLRLDYASASTCTLSAGSARDSGDTDTITLAAAVTLDVTSTGALGLDVAILTGTGAGAGGTTLTGTAGTTFLTAFGTRANGTITTVGTAISAASANLLETLEIDDLIGNAANGYARVISVETAATATLNSALPGGDITTTAVNVVENPTVAANGENQRVDVITSDTDLDATGAWTTFSGSVITAGVEPATPAGARTWFACHLVKGSSGASAVLSTQRTTLLNAPTGYTDSSRLVAYIRDGDTGDFLYQYTSGEGRSKRVAYEMALADSDLDSRLLSTASPSTSWAEVLADHVAPPGCRSAEVNILQQIDSSSTIGMFFLRGRNHGVATVSRSAFGQAGNSANTADTANDNQVHTVLLDAQRGLDYAVQADNHSLFLIDFVAYHWEAP